MSKDKDLDQLEHATNPILLARLIPLGLPDVEVEKRAGLPAAFLSKARSGKQTGTRAADSWRKLEGFVVAEELARKIKPRGVPAPDPAAPGAEGAPVNALAERVKNADSFDELADVIQELAGEILSGGVDRQVAGPVADLLRERRAALKDAVAERAARELAERCVLLTEAEVAEVLEKRKRLGVAPLMPGQNAAPPMRPDGEDEPSEAAGARAAEGWGM